MLLWIIALLLSWPSFSENDSEISTEPTRSADIREATFRHSFSATRKTKTRHAASTYKVLIDKSEFEMRIYDEDGWLATYPVVFGTKDLKDKRMEGDRETPEGKCRITLKKMHKDWGCFLLLDYPNKESIEKFKKRKASGQIPASAKIGGGIGIHGTRPKEEYAVDRYVNWTNGCISLKYSDVFEIYDLLPLGTEVEITP